MSWFGFWIFMAVFVFCEYKLYAQGHDTFFWTHKTPEEKRTQKITNGCDQ